MAWPISIHAQQHRQELSGVVQRVIDGDTLVLLDATQTRRTLRLAGIDAPESRMPHGQQAKVYLAALVFGHEVVATTGKQDRYGRSIATLKVNGNDANLAMIQAGLAWPGTTPNTPKSSLLGRLNATLRRSKWPENMDWACGATNAPLPPGPGGRGVYRHLSKSPMRLQPVYVHACDR